jgi:hypothetical protein
MKKLSKEEQQQQDFCFDYMRFKTSCFIALFQAGGSYPTDEAVVELFKIWR